MKLLLCSDFSNVGIRYLKKLIKNGAGLNCLFVGYACEDDSEMFESSAICKLKDFGFNIIRLTPNYDFSDKIDVIFVRGGNTTKLIDYLKKYGQFNVIKSLVENGAVYIGSSAGSVLVGSDTEWTLDSEPYDVDMKKVYGNDALLGFGWIDKLVFVHTTKYRMCRSYEQKTPDEIFRTLDLECYPAYLNDLKKFKKSQFEKIGNNQVLLVDGKIKKIITYNWRKIPVKILNNEND